MFDKIISPTTNFSAVRDGRNSPDFYFDVDLTNARSINAGTALILNVAGNSFYCDANPTDGNAVVKFQDTNLDRVSTPFYASPGFIANIPFTQILIENVAQPGKKLRIVYGVDVDFQPGSIAQIAVTNAGGFTSVRPEAATGNFVDASTTVANTPITVFTPASNVNGAIVLSAGFTEYGALVGSPVFIRKASAPTTPIDGVIVLAITTRSANASTEFVAASTPQSIFIPAGQGLYFITNTAIAATIGTIRHASYRLL